LQGLERGGTLVMQVNRKLYGFEWTLGADASVRNRRHEISR